jgi:hypothetical protein
VILLSTQHDPMLQRNLVYTGLTWGKRLVVLVGQGKAMAIAVKGACDCGEQFSVVANGGHPETNQVLSRELR